MIMTNGIKAERGGRLAVCIGCTGVIQDQYILRVAPDMEWHASCLKCVDCQQYLDEFCTCFVRDGKTYCKRDYARLFGAKCDKCHNVFEKTDLVMRARTKIYHLDCFRCICCGKQLLPGDEFALRADGLLCRRDFDSLESKANAENNNTTNINNNDIKDRPLKKEKRENKPTRVRTVLNEKQLQTLRQCYNANCRPDALMKEQMVEMTGLSPRVIRVWFQNKRCKDKKRIILMKQMQQEKEKQMALQGLTGVPMVASSPVRHDGGPVCQSGGGGPLDVTAYQPPWKNLSDFAVNHDLDRLDQSAPGFQQLMQQMHGYGADLVPASELLGHSAGSLVKHESGGQLRQPLHALPQGVPHQQVPQGLTPPDNQYEDSALSDSYVSYLESDDSMTTQIGQITSP